MQVRQIRLADIHVKDRAREDKGDIASLAASIKEKGLLQPITVDEDLALLAGERRLLACRRLGWDAIWAVVRNRADKIDRLEVELVENVHRKEMTWQEKARATARLRDHLLERYGETPSLRRLAAITGEHHSTIDRRLTLAEWMDVDEQVGEAKTEDEAWKCSCDIEERAAIMLAKKRVLPDQAQTIGWASDRYMVGDALVEMTRVAGAIADFAEVDPPYGVGLDRRKGRNASSRLMDDYTEVSTDEYVPMLRKTAQEVFRILKEHSFAVFWFGPTHHQVTLDTLREVGFKVPDVAAVWCKNGSWPDRSARYDLRQRLRTLLACQEGSAEARHVQAGQVECIPIRHGAKRAEDPRHRKAACPDERACGSVLSPAGL